MKDDQIRQLIEQIDPEGKIPQDKIDNLVAAIDEMERNPIKDGETRNGVTFHTLKQDLDRETDWRKRASIAAKIISMNLE